MLFFRSPRELREERKNRDADYGGIDFIPRVVGVFPLGKCTGLAIQRRYFGGGVGNMLTLFIYKVAASALIKSWKSRGGRRTEGKERGGEKSTAIFQKAAM